MTWVLVRKLLRDIRVFLIVVAILLAAFQMLWARVTYQISHELPKLLEKSIPGGAEQFFDSLFEQGPAKIVQTLIGGGTIKLTRGLDTLSVGYVHPLTLIILSVWAIGRASAAIAGEIDRGTMELLLAQPISRSRIILSHFLVDVLTIPILCLSMWLGTWAGTCLVGLKNHPSPILRAEPWPFFPALLNVAVLIFATSGSTLLLSAAGRFRSRVLGLAVLLALVQFLINVIGQLWGPLEHLRPLTFYFYYQPQPIIVDPAWYEKAVIWGRLAVLLAVGSAGYLLAWWTFCKRDLPAPL
jgi:ABC-2 type transport system permease protein